MNGFLLLQVITLLEVACLNVLLDLVWPVFAPCTAGTTSENNVLG